MSLPILNLQLYKTNPAQFANQLRHACHTIGFFLLQHDIQPPVCHHALRETRLFFQKPMQDKMTISYENEPSFRGYMPLGVENTEGKVDGREQIEYAAEYLFQPHGGSIMNPNTNQIFNMQEESKYYHRLRAKNPWPDNIQPTLRPAIIDYVSGVLNVADQLREAMCLALNVDPKEVSPLFGKFNANYNDEPIHGTGGDVNDDDDVPFWSMKLVSYPPVNSDCIDEKEVSGSNTNSHPDPTISLQGVGAHTDSNFLTLILQDPHHSGLQVQSVDGTWIDVPPTETNTLVCNIGELAEIWTDGYFLATPHRVMRHYESSNNLPIYTQQTKKDQSIPTGGHGRTSLPIFYNPKLDTVMKPMVDLKNLPWERIQQNQWRREHNSMLSSVGENSFKSLARSHPGVFGQHHGDLRILNDGRIVKR